jgi:hypothetical protein
MVNGRNNAPRVDALIALAPGGELPVFGADGFAVNETGEKQGPAHITRRPQFIGFCIATPTPALADVRLERTTN